MNPAYAPYLNRDRAQARLATALRATGWQIFGYTDGDPDATDEVNLAMWHGYAKHPDYPDVIVVCGIDLRNEPVYRSPAWPDKFGTNGNGWYYHIEFEGKYQTMGSGVSWSGSLSDEAKDAVKNHAEFINRRAAKLVQARTRKAEKAAKKEAAEEKRRLAAEKKANKAVAKTEREAKKAAKTAGAAEAEAEPAEAQEAEEAQEAQEAPKGRGKKDKDVDPADLVVLPAVSPLIADKTPVVIDALVANMLNWPTFLPPETDFATIAAVKIAEHYGFDAAKTTAAARQISALLEDPDVSKLEPRQRNMALRTQARSLLH